MDEDQEICRVCRSESTPDHPLYHPCKCSGSIRFVHEDCLIEWLSHSRKKYCELCEYPYSFSPIYREDMPDKVPFYVLCSQLFHRLVSLLKTCFRGLTVVLVWLILLPNFTLWTWRFYFWSGENMGFNAELLFSNSNSSSTTTSTTIEANLTNHTNETLTAATTNSFLLGSLKDFLSDCLEGQIITAFVIIIFVAAYLFREWVMQNLPAEQAAVPPAPLNEEHPNHEHFIQEQVAVDTLMNAMQVLNNNRDEDDAEDENRHHMQRQLNNLRVELENEVATRNISQNATEHHAWSSLHERVEDQDEGQLFGGVDGMGAGSSSHQPQQQQQHPDANLHRLHHDYNDDGDVEPWTVDAEEDIVPDLIDYEDRNVNDEAIRQMIQQHIAQNPGFRIPPPADRGDPLFADHVREMIAEREEDREAMGEPMAAAAGIVDRGGDAAEGMAAALAAMDQGEDEPLEVGDDINGVLEAVGMRGNPWMLVQNSVLMSLMISLCLGVAVWIPYVVGRLVILIRPISFIETPIYLMRLITDPLVDFILDLCIPYIWSHVGNTVKSAVPSSILLSIQSTFEHVTSGMDRLLAIDTHNATSTVPHVKSKANTSVMMNLEWAFIQTKVESFGSLAIARWHGFATGRTGLDRSMCIFVGYIVLISLGSWYLTHGRRHRSSIRRRGGATTAETVQDIIRQQGIFLKVLFFILIELVVFPTVCGFLLDMATLPLFNKASFTSRYAFHVQSPSSSYFLHWFLGTAVLFYFAIFITVCREIIRRGVMWFIRDPNDPQFHPVQEMVERPLPNLLHKISQSALIYSIMLVFGVGTVTYTLAYTGVVFPLRLPFDTPLSTLALDLLIIQFLLPPLIAMIKPREYAKRALDLWWHVASRQLRLTSFMFDERKPDEEGHHVRRSLKAWLLLKKAVIPTDEFAEVAIDEENADVVFERDGMMVRVPKYDSVPVDPKRRMLVPVDPVTLEAIDEEERRQGHPAAADTVDESQATIVVYIPPYFKQRIIVFLLYMWFSISMFSCSVTVLPLLTGRALFKYYLAPESKVNDFYAFALGFYVMVGVATIAHWVHECYATEYNASNKKEQVMTYIKLKAAKIAKFLYLSSMFGVIIPLLFGIAVDLFVFMPIRSFNTDTGFVIYISQNWSFGVAYMSIIHNVIHVLPANNRLLQKLNEITGDGLMQADVSIITRTVIVPVVLSAILAITIPGVVSWGILQMLDSTDPSIQVTITRYTYPITFGIFMILVSGFLIKKLIHLWMQTVRDDTYLIGKKLHNLQNASTDVASGSSSSSQQTNGPASAIDNATNEVI